MTTRHRGATAALCVVLLGVSALSTVGPAHAQQQAGPDELKADRQQITSDEPGQALANGVPHGSHQHGTNEGHLPPVERNVRLVSKLELTGRFGDVRPGQIADVGYRKGYAYLNSWQSETTASCERGGVFVVDVRRPRRPVEVGFIATQEGSYPGEGNQVIALDTPAFRGDLLTINSEACPTSGTPLTRRGGITLVDVTNPLRPRKLAENFGDITPPSVSELKTNPEHQTHSAFSWQDGSRAFTIMVDNEEAEDVDIVEITDPYHPVLIKELDVATLTDLGTAFGDSVFLHDMVVKEIDGVQTALLSYWDGGYVKLNVEDPANPTFIADTDFAACDPLQPTACPPEGNAHQAEFSHDDELLVGADEDFAPFRLTGTTGGPGEERRFNAAEATDATRRIADLRDERLNGPVRYVGRACDADGPLPPPPADDSDPTTERIALIERGVCTFEEKVVNAQEAGYDAFLVFNNASRPDGDPLLTNAVIMSAAIPGAFITRADALALFGGSPPALGADGPVVSLTPTFDGWGYVHVFDAATMEDRGQYAIREAQDARYARGFGDLSVHETANDPDTNLAYISYYAGGFRVARFGRDGIREVGAFIDEGGNNFWGVQVVDDRPGPRLVLASDRDYGLYIFRYTGPGAVGRGGPNGG
jgi:hypothetical protein